MNVFNRSLSTVLVVASILCLVGFLAFWNVHQYKQAEVSLKKELSFHLESANNQVYEKQLNTFIERLYVSEKKEGNSNSLNDFFLDPLSKIVVVIDSSIVSGVKDSFPKLRRTEFTVDRKTKASLVGQIDRFKKTAPIDSLHSGFPQLMNGKELFNLERFYQNSDKRKKAIGLFEKRLIENKLPHNFVLENDSSIVPTGVLAIAYQTKGLFPAIEEIYFLETGPYLFSKILSSLSFSFFLLALVILAFGVILRSLKNQKRIVEIKNDFISNMTHELKTPISTVSVAIEAIRKYGVINDRAKTEEYLDISSHELDRLSLLVEKVLRTALFESGKEFLNPQLVDLSVLVKETLNTMKLHFDEQKVSLTTDLSDTALWVMGDKMHLTNVVYNLIENAIKYSNENIEISVSTAQLESKAIVTISDKGIGIPVEHQKQIFTKFYRVPNHDHHNVKGHGLGLSYVKQVVDELGGSIELESRQNEGSSFSIHLQTVTI